MVGFGMVTVRARPDPEGGPELPSWMAAIDRISAPGAVRTGFLMTVANPKEIAFCAGAGLVVGGSTPAVGEALAVLLLVIGVLLLRGGIAALLG